MSSKHSQNRNSSRPNDRIIAIIGTVAVHALILLALLFTFLKFPPDGMEWPPQPAHEIVLEEVPDIFASGEFVRTGDNIEDPMAQDEPAPSAAEASQPTQDARDAQNSGVVSQPQKLVTSQQQSPAKAETQQHGPTQEEIEAEKARQEAKRQEEARKNAEQATKNAFGGKGTGSAGSSSGNTATGGEVSGTPGNGVAGRTLERWTSVKSSKVGEICINVKVDAQGHVTSATYNAARSSGTVASDAAMRQRCIERSRQCRFSVLEGADPQNGTITWIFK